MQSKIIPFQDAHVEDAALLLARRHKRDRTVEHALPERFNDITIARTAVETLWKVSGARGVVALHNEHVIGYLIAIPKVEAKWGRTMWINLAGHAIDEDYGAELYRALYAAISPEWVAAGYFGHYILVPANDRSILDAWFSLSFGQEQAHAIRETEQDIHQENSIDPSLEIRQATPTDREGILQIIDIVRRHQSRSPVYSALLPEHLENLAEDVDELLSDKAMTLWLALRNGRVLAFQLYEPAEPASDNLYVPEHCIELGLAATREDEQGRGIGGELTRHTLKWAQEAGYTYCIADWRVTNLLSSRFWPRQGFRPVAYRLTRTIDERITWARG